MDSHNQFKKLSFAVSVMLLLMSCSLTSVLQRGAERLTEPDSSEQGEDGADEGSADTSSWLSGFEEAPLPDDFPEEFPVPENALTGKAETQAGEGGTRALIAMEMELDQVLAYYYQALPANGWSILEESSVEEGTDLLIENPEWEGELFFIPYLEGVVLDATLRELGSGYDIPDIEEITEVTQDPSQPGGGDFGEWKEAGETVPGIPPDLPLPPNAERIELTDELAEAGYVVAFRYPEQPELTLATYTTSLAAGGWEVLDMEVEIEIRLFRLPISDPNSGFQGTALITNNPEMTGITDFDGTVIAIKMNQP
jgi:hypothetical protein